MHNAMRSHSNALLAEQPLARNVDLRDLPFYVTLFILLLCKPHVEYKNTDNDWNHIRPASLDLKLTCQGKQKTDHLTISVEVMDCSTARSTLKTVNLSF